MDFIWLIVLAALGIAMMCKPKLLWRIDHMFTVKNGEPSDLYIALMRIGGVAFLLSALGIGAYVLIGM